jgi:hypothetical protein
VRATLSERLYRRCIRTASGCLEWQGSTRGKGYGSIYADGHHQSAHRVAYELAKGAVPPECDLDHLCRNRRCVNPEHLEPVSRRENVLRGRLPLVASAQQRAKFQAQTHCKRGHEFTPENTHIRLRDGYECRVCKECQRSRGSKWWGSRRTKAEALKTPAEAGAFGG